jgi:AcrR family transcriptional regulator
MTLDLRVPVQARSVRTRRDLVAAARREFGARGYALTTAKSIAARAGVGTGTFYHYFPDKDVVLREIVAERVAQLEASLVARDAEVKLDGKNLVAVIAELRRLIRKDIKSYVDYHAEDKGLHAVISERRLCDRELDAIMAAVEQRGVRRTAEALKRWGFAGDAQAAAFMIFSLIDGAVHNHVLADSALSDARFVDGLTQAILSIGAPPEMLAALSKSR